MYTYACICVNTYIIYIHFKVFISYKYIFKGIIPSITSNFYIVFWSQRHLVIATCGWILWLHPIASWLVWPFSPSARFLTLKCYCCTWGSQSLIVSQWWIFSFTKQNDISNTLFLCRQIHLQDLQINRWISQQMCT